MGSQTRHYVNGKPDNASDWQPGMPIRTVADVLAARRWPKERALELQRRRRASMLRIDYYPNRKVTAIIEAAIARATVPAQSSYTAVLDALIEGWADEFPELSSAK